MKKSYIVLFIALFSLQPIYTQTYQWVKSHSLANNFNPDYAQVPSITDASGNFIICNLHSFKLLYDGFYGDVVFRKYNSAGSEILSKIMTGKATIKGVETDVNNNIYIYGSFMDTLRIDSLNFILNNGTGFNVNDFLIKFNSSGGVVWKKNISIIYGNNSAITALKVKSSYILAGIFDYSFQAFVKKMDMNGNELLNCSIIPARTISGLDADLSGNILAAGSCQMGNIQFSGLNVNCPYVYSLFFAKFNSTGAGIWAKFVEDVTFENPKIVCDDAGNGYACGDLNSATTFGTIQTQGPQWVYDFYLTKYDQSGTFLWVKEVPHSSGNITGDAGVGRMGNLKIDAQNNAYIIGFQRGSINWGNFTTISAGTNDLLVLKYNSNGNLLWGKLAGNANGERGDAISLDNLNNIYVSGNFETSTLFDTIFITGSGLINSFAAKLSNPPTTGVITQNNNPIEYSLSNYPNPFNPETIINYQIPVNSNVKVTVFDVTGKELIILVDQKQNAGNYQIKWNASSFPSGTYFCKLETAGYTRTMKMVLVK